MKRMMSYAMIGLTTLGSLPMPASAAMVGTEQVIAAQQHEQRKARLQAALERDDVAQALAARGVDPAEAQARVAAMTEDELARFGAQIDQLPAGGSVVAVIGVVFVVLLVLELVGVTNVFTDV